MSKHRLHRFLKHTMQLIFLVTVHWSLFTLSHADETISSTELINNAKEYDNKMVIYKGEVIGDIMVRGKFSWINVNDGVNAIGIWSDKDLVKDILYTGSYKSRGDIIEVKGVFHRACLEHGGDMDIHTQALRRINSGEIIKEPVDINKRKLAFILLGALIIIFVLSWLARKA